MIKINLLEKRQKTAEQPAAAAALPGAVKSGLGGLPALGALLIVALGAAFLGWQAWSTSRQTKDLQDKIAAADQRIAELKLALKAVSEFQAKRQILEQKVQVISDLKRRQEVPVHLLDQLSRQVPDFLWLEGLDEKEGGIQLRGKATNFNAVSNFYNNLAGSPYFSDVTLGSTQRAPQGVSFVLSCKFKPPAAQKAPAAEPPAAEARKG